MSVADHLFPSIPPIEIIISIDDLPVENHNNSIKKTDMMIVLEFVYSF